MKWRTMNLKLLSKELLKDIEETRISTSKITLQSHKSIFLCRKLLSTYRKEITSHDFGNIAQEIDFFKNIKHIPLSQLIYHTELYKFDLAYPQNSIEVQRKYIKKHLSRYNAFFLQHIDFGQYLELGSTHLDAYYFTRKSNKELPIGYSYIYFQDPEFSTPKDALHAQFKGYELMVPYLKKRLSKLSNDDWKLNPETSFNLKCGASKTDIVELTYSLIASGAVKGDIKELIRAFEFIFNVELGDFYRTFISIRDRAIDPAKFLDSLKMSLLKRIEEMDG